MMTEHLKHWDIKWEVDDFQISRTIDFYDQHRHNVCVRARERRNIQKIGLDFSKDFVWKSLVSCLLTTQQRSGPTSNVARLLRTVPFPLTLQFCLDNFAQLDMVAQDILSGFGGIRRTSTIAEQLKDNLQSILANDWLILKELTNQEVSVGDKVWEQSLANAVQKQVDGFGPKQSRNFLQILGVTKYEIPLDSRIMDWLNKNNFPIHLTATGLSDPFYYKFISDGIQHLCDQAKIYPCLLDAAIFSSYDNGKWTEENFVF